MTTAIVDQPPPIPTDRRPSWDLVIAYVDEAHLSFGVSMDVVRLVLDDMRDRDAIGRERYGTPLTSGNGRDHLVDAYAELLDASVYLMNELDEHGVSLTSKIGEDEYPDHYRRWYLRDVQHLCLSQIRASIQLRLLIKERDDRATEAS